MKELTGKVALVTGGSRGIGAAIAQRLARDGAAVALTYVSSADKARAVAKQIDADGGRALVMRADNADPGAVTAAVEQTVESLGRIDILVNNAGIFTGGPLEEMTVEQVDRLWAVNVRAVFVAAQAAARHMGRGRAHHHDRQRAGRAGPGTGPDPVCHGQVGADRPDQGPGPRPRPARDHRHRGARRPDRHRHEPRRRPGADFLSSVTALGRYGTRR